MDQTAGQQASQELINEFVVASHFNAAKVRELLPQHPELLDAAAVWNERPIQAASHMGNVEIIDYLLGAGAPMDIFTAAVLGRLDDVREFLDRNPDLVNTLGVHDFPILFFPAVGGQIEVAELLLARGASVTTGTGANTPLHGAAGFGKLEMTRWLLDHGADVTAPGFENKTALQMAEENNQSEVAALLRERGATS